MTFEQCDNCGKRTGHKRALGWGTFFMVLLTFGFWLLAIPLYPVRCIACGATPKTKASDWLWLILPLIFLLWVVSSSQQRVATSTCPVDSAQVGKWFVTIPELYPGICAARVSNSQGAELTLIPAKGIKERAWADFRVPDSLVGFRGEITLRVGKSVAGPLLIAGGVASLAVSDEVLAELQRGETVTLAYKADRGTNETITFASEGAPKTIARAMKYW